MLTRRALRQTLRACTAAAVYLAAGAGIAYAAESTAPHVPLTPDTDACAMCHRAHLPASDTWYRPLASAWETRSALILGTSVGIGDTGMCYVCHGIESLGSESDVQSSLESTSAHRMAPYSSPFGPSPKQCSDCHDSHGSNRTASGTPYPALLRAVTSTAQIVTSGERYCAVCHSDRADDIWDGYEVWTETSHSRLITEPASGTRIRCSVCHDPHGSDIAPSIVSSVLPPAVAATVTAPANDRRLCFACHPAALATWPGSATYQTSAHGSTVATVALRGEWPSRDITPSAAATRSAGECQACHAPMGSADPSGAPVPKMLEREGRALCDTCHDADGPAATDLASLAVTAGASSAPELAVVWRPSVETSHQGRVALYTRDVTPSVPASLVGPREYLPSARAGKVAVGDITGDGLPELVVGDRCVPRVDVWQADPLRGISRRLGPGTLTLSDSPFEIAIGDVFADGTGLRELAVVSRGAAPSYASTLAVYRFDGVGLSEVATGIPLGNDVTSIALGNVTGTPATDIVVTASGDDRFRILTESTVTSDTLVVGGPYVTRSKPRGASIGDVHVNAGLEIVIVNAGEVSGQVSVFDASGAALGHYDTSTWAGADVAYDSLCADVLPGVTPAGTSGLEVLVVSRSDPVTSAGVAISTLNVFPQLAAGGLDTASRQRLDTGLGYESSSLDAGDLDGDGRAEAVVGNAGRWLRHSTHRSPSVQVFRANVAGTALLSPPETRFGGGTERAGEPPAVIVADLGLVGPTRHPIDAVPGVHVSTETATLTRHVTCADCHDSHIATSTPASAPNVYGALKGTWGAAITFTGVGPSMTFAQAQGVSYEYQVCLKCHSAYSDLAGARNVASEVNTRNPSTHGSPAASGAASNTLLSFVSADPSWTVDSVLYCVTCHGNSSGVAPRGPHRSAVSPMLRHPFFGLEPGDSGSLCFRCHKRTVYFTGGEDSTTTASNSQFYDPTLAEKRLHALHTNDYGYGCRACHVGHGSALNHHIQSGGNLYEHADTGGACTTPCHLGTPRREYSRVGIAIPPVSFVSTPTTYSVPVSNGAPTGDLASLQATDGDLLTVRELGGASSATNPRFDIRIGFTGLAAAPASLRLHACYQSNAAHVATVDAWNFVTGAWETRGTIPSSASLATYEYGLSDDHFLAGEVRIRISHPSSGNTNHYQHIDVAKVVR